MKFLIALLVVIGAQRSKEPKVFYYDGKDISTLSAIFVPNIGRESFHLFVKSPYELKYAAIDSSQVGMCLLDQNLTNEMRLKGRWYKINWETKLKTGTETHIILLTARSGKISEKRFTINVEGTKESGKPLGENK